MNLYRRRLGLSFVITVFAIMGCVNSEPPVGEGVSVAAPQSSTSPSAMTPDLRAAYITSVQADASEAYRAERDVSGAARFVHLAQGFEATIDGADVRLATDVGTWELSLSTTGIGCEGASEIGLPTASVEMSGNRVEIARPDVREWYVNGPLGLEQGFTVESAPACVGTKVVTLEVGGSAVPELVDEDGDGRGEAIAFTDAEGLPLARYTDLYVKDATGKRLDAWMSVTAGRIALHVDDTDAAYPVQIDPLIWVQQANLTASDGVAGDRLGGQVAVDGDTALVGARGANLEQGAAYVFTRSGGAWTQQQKLTASDGAANDAFGSSVAINGDTALVGANGTNSEQGAAYVFTRMGATWTQQQKLTASDGGAYDAFGTRIALSGDTVLVGAYGANDYEGAAYVFTRMGTVWTEQQKLTPSDGLQSLFGLSIAISGDTALVGAPWSSFGQGAAYIFTRTGGVWMEQQKLIAEDGAEDDLFGNSVALSGDTALVGAYDEDGGDWTNVDRGAVYVFTRAEALWTQRQKLIASNVVGNGHFGTSVALSGNTAVVGATYHASGGNGNRGWAYVFTRTGDEVWSAWNEEQMLMASEDATNDFFGSSVALSGEETVLVGTSGATVGANSNQGSVYVFSIPKNDAINGGDGVNDPSSVGCQAAGAPSGKTSFVGFAFLGIALLVTRRRRRAAIA